LPSAFSRPSKAILAKVGDIMPPWGYSLTCLYKTIVLHKTSF
jgi:hypothetical protein